MGKFLLLTTFDGSDSIYFFGPGGVVGVAVDTEGILGAKNATILKNEDNKSVASVQETPADIIVMLHGDGK